MEEEHKSRNRNAGYKLGGQIKTLDNAKAAAAELSYLSGALVAKMNPRINRDVNKELASLVDDIESCRNRVVYHCDTAISQNMNARNILETGEEYDD